MVSYQRDWDMLCNRPGRRCGGGASRKQQGLCEGYQYPNTTGNTSPARRIVGDLVRFWRNRNSLTISRLINYPQENNPGGNYAFD